MATFGFDVPVQETVFYKQVKQEGVEEGLLKGREEGREEGVKELVRALRELHIDPELLAKALERVQKGR